MSCSNHNGDRSPAWTSLNRTLTSYMHRTNTKDDGNDSDNIAEGKLNDSDATYIIAALSDETLSASEPVSSPSSSSENKQTLHEERRVIVIYALYAILTSQFVSDAAVKRVATDGILPYCMSSYESGCGGAVEEKTSVLMHCVAVIVDATVVMYGGRNYDMTFEKYLRYNTRTKDGEGGVSYWNDLRKMLHGGDGSTLSSHDEAVASALELLLSNMLAHLDAMLVNEWESDDNDNSSSLFVDQVLDVICGCSNLSCSEDDNQKTYLVHRPSLAATISSVLRELECMFNAGRLSSSRKSAAEKKNSSSNKHYRIECLLHNCLFPALFSPKLIEHEYFDGTTTIVKYQLDAIPPLVYQLCLFVTKLDACNDTHRIACLAAIADAFDALRTKLEENSELGDNTRRNIFTEKMLRWTESNALSHVGSALRHNQDLGKSLVKLVKNGGIATNAKRSRPYRYLYLTEFRCALVLTAAFTVTRIKAGLLVLLRDLIFEEHAIYWYKVRMAAYSCYSHSFDFHSCQIKKKSNFINSVSSTLMGDIGSDHIMKGPHHVSSCLSKLAFDFTSIGGDAGSESLLSSLMQLGFLMIDCVKKDTTDNKLASTLNQEVSKNVALCGRKLLASLFETGSDSLRRAVLAACSSRVCGRAPNAVEHSKLVHVLSSRSRCISLFAEYIPMIVEWLTYIPNGGIPCEAITSSVIPCLRVLLTIRRSYADQAFLMTKKALFCTNIEQRVAAAHLLVMLLEVALNGDARNVNARDSSLVDEIKGYLRRSLTQQRDVRSAVYKAIGFGLRADRNSDETKQIFLQILHRQLERYIPNREDDEEKATRQQRGRELGTQLSQIAKEDENTGTNETSFPFRVDACIGTYPDYTKCKSLSGKARKRKITDVSTDSHLKQVEKALVEPIADLMAVCCEAQHLFPECEVSTSLKKLRTSLLILTSASTLSSLLSRPKNDQKLSTTICLSLLVDSLFGADNGCNELAPISRRDNDPEKDKIDQRSMNLSLFKLRLNLVNQAVDILSLQNTNRSCSKKKKSDENKENENNDSSPETLRSSVKIREQVEEFISNHAPILSGEFLSSNLEPYNASSQEAYKIFVVHKAYQTIHHQSNLPDSQYLDKLTYAMKLGPILFCEFCGYAEKFNQERNSSIVCKNESNSSLIYVAIRAWKECINMMGTFSPTHDLSSSARVSAFLMSSIMKYKSNAFAVERNVDDDDKLYSIINYFVEPMRNGKRGLLKEILMLGLDYEAKAFCEAIKSAASFLENSQHRSLIGLSILKCFEIGRNGDESVHSGLLNVDVDDSNIGNCILCAVKAIETSISLDGGLDGETLLPTCTSLYFQSSANPSLFSKNWRYCRKFPSLDMSDWEDTEVRGGNATQTFGYSVLQVCCHELSKYIDVGHAFEEILESQQVPNLSLQNDLACIEVLATATNGTLSKHISAIASLAFKTIESSLQELEFLFSKITSHASSLKDHRTLQEFIAGRLIAICGLLCTLSPFVENMDSTNTITANTLKYAKRFYMSFTKILLNFTGRAVDLTAENSNMPKLIDMISSVFSGRFAALLYVVQDQKEIGKKILGQAKIESLGKAAISLVFERERSDAAILKLCKELKKDKEVGKSAWLESKLGSFQQTDFRIKRNDINAAREKETINSKKKNTKKERVVVISEDANNKRKRKIIPKFENGQEGEDDEIDNYQADNGILNCLEDESGSENEEENMSDEENSITREFIDWGDEGSVVEDEEETDDE